MSWDKDIKIPYHHHKLQYEMFHKGPYRVESLNEAAREALSTKLECIKSLAIYSW